MTKNRASIGYTPCGCRDCFELAIGTAGTLCNDCAKAGCDVAKECQAPSAYGDAEKTEPAVNRRPYQGWAWLFLRDAARWQLRRARTRLGRIVRFRVAR